VLLLARASRKPEARLPALVRLTGKGSPDKAVVAALWPDEWTVEEAAEIVRAAPERFWLTDALVERLDQVLLREDEPRTAWKPYLAVCEFVDAQKLGPHLSALSEARVHGISQARSLIRTSVRLTGRDLADRVHKLLDMMTHGELPVKKFLAGQTHVLFLRLEPDALAALLPKLGSKTRDDYRVQLSGRLAERPDGDALRLATTTFEAYARLRRKEPAVARELEQVLADTVARWKTRDLDDLEDMVAGAGVKGLASAFGQWREERVPKGIGRFLPRRRH
jgi:hypothetical protein